MSIEPIRLSHHPHNGAGMESPHARRQHASQQLLTLLLHARQHHNEQARQHHKLTEYHQTDANRLPTHKKSQGTTVSLPSSERHRVMHHEGVHASAHTEAHTWRNVQHSDNKEPTGNVEVTVPPAIARRMGLLGSHDHDRSVTVTLPKKQAAELGLLGPSATDSKQ